MVPTTIAPLHELTTGWLTRSMRDEELVGQLILVSLESPADEPPVVRADHESLTMISQARPGGFILFSPNLIDIPQVQMLTQDLYASTGVPPLIATDNEGGNVSRLTASGKIPALRMPSATLVGYAAGHLTDQGNESAAANLTRRWAHAIGEQLRALGITVNLAPVADVSVPTYQGFLSSQRRTFGDDPGFVGLMVGAAVAGFRESGVLPVLKHFPGQGAARLDSHATSVDLPVSGEDLRQTELVPFAAGIEAGATAVMTAHVSYPLITGNDKPATVSREIITGILREQLGFDGLVLTDAINMEGIGGWESEGELALDALGAGADIIVKPREPVLLHAELVRAVQTGEVSRERVEESVKRILRAKVDLGLFGPAPLVADPAAAQIIGSPAHHELDDEIRRLARERSQ